MNTATKLIKKTLQKERKGITEDSVDYRAAYRERLIAYRKEPLAIVRLKKPTNIPRARSLGYKAKEGIIVVRARVRRGSGIHHRPSRGRKPKRMGVKKLTRRISIQGMAEQRAGKKYPSYEVLNSYNVGDDGRHHYFEIILVNPSHPAIKKDKDFQWLVKQKQTGRVFRGKTSAQRRSRGLQKKTKASHKNRPSLRANNRTAK